MRDFRLDDTRNRVTKGEGSALKQKNDKKSRKDVPARELSSDKPARRRSAFYRETPGGAVGRSVKFVRRAARKGVVGRYMSGYDSLCEKFEHTKFVRKFSYIRKRLVRKNSVIKRQKMPEEASDVLVYDEESLPMNFTDRFSSAFDRSVTVGIFKAIKDRLLYTPVSSYGVLSFSFALFMLITQSLCLLFTRSGIELPAVATFSGEDNVVSIMFMSAAVILMTVSMALIFTREVSLYSYMAESRITGFVLKNLLGIRTSAIDGRVMKRNSGLVFVIGMIFGLITFFIPPARFLGTMAVIALISVITCIPEFGLLFLVFTLPFYSLFRHPTIFAVIICLCVLISTLIKVLRGKRSFAMDPLDSLIFLFIILVFFGGVITFGGIASFNAAITMTVMGLIYFSVTALIKSKEWVERILSAFMASSIIVSFIGILQRALNLQSDIWQDNEVFASISGRVFSLWENPNVLAEYILIAFFMSSAYLMFSKKQTRTTFSLVTMAMSLLCLALTWSRGAWLSLAVSVVIMLVVRTHKSLPWVVILILAAFIFLPVAPEPISERISSIVTFSDSSVIYRMNIWSGVSRMVRRYFISGIGVGESAFRAVYPDYALSGIESAPHAHSLFAQILAELGICGLFVFILVVILLFRSAFTLFEKWGMRNGYSLAVLALSCGILALLINGLTDYIWYNYRIYLCFWIMMGLITSVRRQADHTETFISGEPDAFDLDIKVSGKSRARKKTALREGIDVSEKIGCD